MALRRGVPRRFSFATNKKPRTSPELSALWRAQLTAGLRFRVDALYLRDQRREVRYLILGAA